MKKILYGGKISLNPSNYVGTIESNLQRAGHNSGNLLFVYAMDSHLGDLTEKNISLFRTPVKEIKKKCNHIIITAANIVNSYSDWGMYADKIEELDLPVTLVSVGIQAKEGENIHLKKGTLRFLRAVSKRSYSIGARGYRTAQALCDVGIANVDVMGCPSAFINKNIPHMVSNKHKKINNTAISATYYLNNRNIKQGLSHIIRLGIENDSTFIAQDEKVALKLANNEKFTDEELKQELLSYDPSGKNLEVLKKYFATNTKIYFDVEKWLHNMQEYDFLVGSRFHGNMAAVQAGVPALFVVIDMRTKEMIDYLRLPNITLENLEKNKLSMNELYKLADYDNFNKNYSLLYNNYIDFLNKNNITVNLQKMLDIKYLTRISFDMRLKFLELNAKVNKVKINF